MITIKLHEDTDLQLRTILLLVLKKYKLRLTRDGLVKYALKALVEKTEMMGETKKDGDAL